MARLYSNENFPLPVVEELRRLGHDILTTQDAGQAGSAVPDVEVLGYASSQKRAILTLNRKDFVHLHGKRPDHAGIIACTFDPKFIRQARRIHERIAVESELRRRLIRVNRPSSVEN